MKQIGIAVEGPTEESFISTILTEYLVNKSIFLYPIVVQTRRERSGKKYKGGIISYNHLKNDISILLQNPKFDIVTTMIDYYGLPSNFPGINTMPAADPYTKVKYLETEFSRDINSDKFVPYIALHEFETLLFSSVDKIAENFPNNNPRFNRIVQHS